MQMYRILSLNTLKLMNFLSVDDFWTEAHTAIEPTSPVTSGEDTQMCLSSTHLI